MPPPYPAIIKREKEREKEKNKREEEGGFEEKMERAEGGMPESPIERKLREGERPAEEIAEAEAAGEGLRTADIFRESFRDINEKLDKYRRVPLEGFEHVQDRIEKKYEQWKREEIQRRREERREEAVRQLKASRIRPEEATESVKNILDEMNNAFFGNNPDIKRLIDSGELEIVFTPGFAVQTKGGLARMASTEFKRDAAGNMRPSRLIIPEGFVRVLMMESEDPLIRLAQRNALKTIRHEMRHIDQALRPEAVPKEVRDMVSEPGVEGAKSVMKNVLLNKMFLKTGLAPTPEMREYIKDMVEEQSGLPEEQLKELAFRSWLELDANYRPEIQLARSFFDQFSDIVGERGEVGGEHELFGRVEETMHDVLEGLRNKVWGWIEQRVGRRKPLEALGDTLQNMAAEGKINQGNYQDMAEFFNRFNKKMIDTWEEHHFSFNEQLQGLREALDAGRITPEDFQEDVSWLLDHYVPQTLELGGMAGTLQAPVEGPASLGILPLGAASPATFEENVNLLRELGVDVGALEGLPQQWGGPLMIEIPSAA